MSAAVLKGTKWMLEESAEPKDVTRLVSLVRRLQIRSNVSPVRLLHRWNRLLEDVSVPEELLDKTLDVPTV